MEDQKLRIFIDNMSLLTINELLFNLCKFKLSKKDLKSYLVANHQIKIFCCILNLKNNFFYIVSYLNKFLV